MCELTIPGAKVPGNFCSRGRKCPRTFAPGSVSSQELSLPGTKVLSGTFAPRSKNTEERKVLIPQKLISAYVYFHFKIL